MLFENVDCDQAGYWFTFSRSKQRNKLEETTICVPRRQSDWLACAEDLGRRPVDYDPASVIDTYFETVMQDLSCNREDLSGGFFKGTHGKLGKRFVNSNVGKNTLAQVGIEIASELCLRDPETYTGHCWRRSAGTNASNSGVNVTTLMSMMGWSCPKTAIQYVKRSRTTSLQMSMYLANVQRRNCPDPFPTSTERFSRKKKFRREETLSHLFTPETTPTKTNNRSFSTLSSVSKPHLSSFVLPENQNVDSKDCSTACVNECVIGTRDIEVGVENGLVPVCSNVVTSDSIVVSSPPPIVSVPPPVVSVASNNFDLTSVDPRLMNFLQNFQNNGSMQIHFHFGDVKK